MVLWKVNFFVNCVNQIFQELINLRMKILRNMLKKMV